MERAWPGVRAGGACPHATTALGLVLAQEGVVLVPQGGTAQWRRLPAELDDGVVATHFAYELDDHDPRVLHRLAAGLLPEMHVWGYLPQHDEVVDLVTGDLPEQCVARAGLPWLTPRPAPWSWWRRDEQAPGVYHATVAGSRIAGWAIRTLLPEARTAMGMRS